jgi:HAMP domain-containing protein
MADPIVPVSWGELLDKIAILEIKQQQLRSPQALANARRELAALQPSLTMLEPAPGGLPALRSALAEVNRRLWTIEDRIREKDAQGDFGAEFVALARSVYRENDERGRIKRDINTLLQSTLMEEKQYSAY